MMELTKSEEELVKKLFMKIQKQRNQDKINERYYRGMQQIGNLGISVPPDVQPFAFPLNWCRTYIDVLEERQDVRLLIRSGEITEDKELRLDWEANDLDVQSHLVHKDLTIYGRAFVSVAADPAGGRPRIRAESPRDMAAIVDPLTRSMTAALRIYRDSVGIAEHMTLYLPDSTVIMGKEMGMWKAQDRIEHSLERVPIVMMINRQQSGSFEGETQLSDLKPIVDMAGRVMLQLQLAMETVATPQKIALGVSEEDFVDENGEQLDPWDTYLGAVWALSKKDAKVEQLAGASLTGFHDTIKMLAEQASTITGLPVRMMGQNTANPAAEGAIRADESRLVKQVERINSVAGAGWAWALGIAERIRTREWSADGKIQILWRNPGTPTEAQQADAMQKLTGGRPTLSVRGAMNEMGWPQARIDREIEWLSQEEAGTLLQKLERDAEP
ncbi:phage portal protein [Corynebacterium diphtheriae]|nr:phage portal protein [Corynebacterium diphtheriae]CAB0876441.1 phage portal protein [Corynebacterium diphtheriae]CAB0889016.1 phage portal protein [Corynebacterium diphtheriae]